MSKNKKNKNELPSFTIDGKRLILKNAVLKLGEAQVTAWLEVKGIPSLRYFNDHVRRYGPKYFRELFELSQ
jgi:hypothetical protein